MKEYIKPIIEEEKIEIDDICTTSVFDLDAADREYNGDDDFGLPKI